MTGYVKQNNYSQNIWNKLWNTSYNAVTFGDSGYSSFMFDVVVQHIIHD